MECGRLERSQFSRPFAVIIRNFSKSEGSIYFLLSLEDEEHQHQNPDLPLSNLLTNILAESSSAIPSMSLSCLQKGFLSLPWNQISTLYLSLESTPEQLPTLSALPCVSAAFT